MKDIAEVEQAGFFHDLDTLTQQARFLSENLAMNMLQLGHVLVEAKSLVPHGEWSAWLEENCQGMSDRSAQSCMAAYRRFGENPEMARLGKAKLLKLTALPPEAEATFLTVNDVESMSAREVEAAVRAAKQEAEKAIQAERAARLAAEQRAQEAENRPPAIPDEITQQMEDQREEIQRLAAVSHDALEETNRLRAENAALNREITDQVSMLEESQADFQRVSDELLNLKSEQARGDAERVPTGELTLDVFASHVRQFIGGCARLPHMSRTLSTMDLRDRNGYDELLRTVEAWCADSRRAMDAVQAGGVIHA